VFTNLKKEQLDDIVINFIVYHDSLTSREALGCVSISSSSTGNDYIQWKEMIEGKKSIAWWHGLNPLGVNNDSDTGNNSGLCRTPPIASKSMSMKDRKSSRSINLANFKLRSS
jgi:hypothetical protein